MIDEEQKNYIVPAKLLLGVVVKTSQESVNDKTTEVIKKIEGNKEIKQMLFDLSRKMTEFAENEGMFVIIPDFIPPEENVDYSKMISSFITEMVNGNNVAASNPTTMGPTLLDSNGIIEMQKE